MRNAVTISLMTIRRSDGVRTACSRHGDTARRHSGAGRRRRAAAPRRRPHSTCSSGSTMRRSCSCMPTASASCRSRRRCSIWHLYQAAIAGRDIYYDQRYAHNLEMRDVLEAIVTHPTGVDATTLAEIQRYTKLFWINTGPYNNLTARKFVLKCTPEAFAAAAHAAEKAGAHVSAARRRDARPAAGAAAADVLRPERRPDGHREDAAAGQGHPHRERQQPVRRRHDEGPRGLPRGAPAQLAAGEDRTASWSRRSTGSAAATASRSAAIVAAPQAAIPFATEPMANALRALITFYQTGETQRPRGVRHRLGAGQGVAGRHDQRLHRGLPRRARHQGRVGSAGLLRQPGEDLRDPEARRERAVVRGPHAVGREVPQAGRAGHHRQRHRRGRSKPATPGRSRRSASTCRTTSTSASSTAASRCRCRTSTRPTTSRRCRRSAASSRGRRRKPSAATKWSALAGELHDRTCTK